MSTQDDLNLMVKSMPESIENLENSLAQIDAANTSTDLQIAAITDGVCASSATELQNYLTLEKVPYLQETVNATAYLVIDPTFGAIAYANTLSGWSIHALVEQAQPLPPELPVAPIDEVIYSTTVNWDSDAYITAWMADWSEGNDYITRPNTSGATYGLLPQKENLTAASNILNENKTKLESAQATFSKYLV